MQLPTRPDGYQKVQVMFNATKYFKIKCYVRWQPLTFTYQALLDKSKVYKQSLAYYENPRNPQIQQRPKSLMQVRPGQTEAVNQTTDAPYQVNVMQMMFT